MSERCEHGRLFGSVSKQMRLSISRKLRDNNLPINEIQAFILLDIKVNPGTCLRDIGKRLLFDKPTITKCFKKLLSLSYIISVQDTEDKRKYRIYHTEESEKIIEEIKEISKEVREISYRGLSVQEVEQANSLMKRINNNLMENNR